MLLKLIIILFMLLILGSLFSALYHLVRNRDKSTQVVKALTWRISLSLVLFILLILAFASGLIVPHPGP